MDMSESTPLLHGAGGGLRPWQTKAYLYGAHGLQAFGDRMWAFAVPILFMNVFPESLLPSALFSMILYLGNMVLMAPIGSWVDRSDRLRVMKTAVCGQGMFILVNVACLWALLPFVPDDGRLVMSTPIVIIFAALMVSAILAELMGNAATLSIERDWTVVIARGESAVLTNYNAILRRLDLGCALVAPTVFGLLLTGVATWLAPEGSHSTIGVNHTLVRVGSGAVAVWNVLAMLPEYLLAKKLYDGNPELQTKVIEPRVTHAPGLGYVEHWCFHTRHLFSGWCEFLTHPVAGASFSYCLLYLTILDGGTLMTAYLKWLGVSEALLGATRGVGALLGIVGTTIFPTVHRCTGSLRKTGSLFAFLFFLSVVPAAYCFLMHVPPMTKAYLVLGAVAGSRIFLWGFDLAHTQVMQESIAESQRGNINACQTALYQFFWVVVGALGVWFNDPKEFHVLVLVSVACVGLSALGWSTWAAFAPPIVNQNPKL